MLGSHILLHVCICLGIASVQSHRPMACACIPSDPSLVYPAIGAILLATVFYRVGSVHVPRKGKVNAPRLLAGAAVFQLVFRIYVIINKRKDDLIALSGALGLEMTGSVSKLASKLRSHLAAHPEIQDNPCFFGLFR